MTQLKIWQYFICSRLIFYRLKVIIAEDTVLDFDYYTRHVITLLTCDYSHIQSCFSDLEKNLIFAVYLFLTRYYLTCFCFSSQYTNMVYKFFFLPAAYPHKYIILFAHPPITKNYIFPMYTDRHLTAFILE